MPAGNLNRLTEARALDDVEAVHLFFCLGERTVGYQHLAVADADGGGVAARPEPGAAAPVVTIMPQATAVQGIPRG
jgi:hypothetical protein